jgi:transposase-like protein
MNEEMTKKKDVKNLLPDAVVDELLARCEKPEDLMKADGVFAQMTKQVMERALGAELSHHLGYEAGERPPAGEPNRRNGYSGKTLVGEHGEVRIEVPRDRAGEYEPQLVRKRQKRFEGFDEKIIAMYARGMTVREIQGFLQDQYRVEVSADLISTVTSAVLEEVKAWQNRPLERIYPVVFLDALRVKIRDEGLVRNKAVYLALGITLEGTKEVLGLWIEQNEGAKFWLRVCNELKNRGVSDILIAVVDGLKGFPEAINAVFPETTIQTCIVHLLRYSLAFCGWKDRQAVARELKSVYAAENAESARERLEEFAQSEWAKKYPTIVPSWERAWDQVIPFLSYPMEIRRVIYTTNAIESLHMQLRKVLKNRGHFPNDESAAKLIYLALQNITRKWNKPAVTWKKALAQFAIVFSDRLMGPASWTHQTAQP